MSDSEEEDVPRQKVKKTLLTLRDRQGSRLNFKGVKSYLHQFYEYATVGNAVDNESHCYVKSKRIRVKSIWWRVILATGVFLMVLGAMGVLISYVVPRKSELVVEEDELAIVDKEAQVYNHNLELLKLASLVTFCIGGISSSLALLIASCCWKCCSSFDDDLEPSSMAKKLVDEDELAQDPPLSPVECRVPGMGSVFGVQPAGQHTSPSPYPVPLITTGQNAD